MLCIFYNMNYQSCSLSRYFAKTCLIFFPAEIAQKYHISKYPTLKVFRNGEIQKREYRGQRSPDALANFVKEQLKDPVKEFTSMAELNKDVNFLCLVFSTSFIYNPLVKFPLLHFFPLLNIFSLCVSCVFFKLNSKSEM